MQAKHTYIKLFEISSGGNECIWIWKRAVNKFPICVQCAGNVHKLGAKFGKTANVCFVFPDKELGVVLPGSLGATLAALLLPAQPRCVCSISRVTSNFRLDV